jgi:hypothetical protein
MQGLAKCKVMSLVFVGSGGRLVRGVELELLSGPGTREQSRRKGRLNTTENSYYSVPHTTQKAARRTGRGIDLLLGHTSYHPYRHTYTHTTTTTA